MLKKYILSFTVFCISILFCKAQDSSSVVPYSKKQGNLLTFLEYNYSIGAYEEVIRVASKYSSKNSSDPVHFRARVTSLEALSWIALQQPVKAEELIKQFVNLTIDSTSKEYAQLTQLAFADYYEQTGNFVKAAEIISLLNTNNTNIAVHPKVAREIYWHEANVYYNTGFYDVALKLLQKLETLSGKDSLNDKRFSEPEQEKIYRRNIQLDMIILKALCFANKGKYNQGDSILKTFNEKKLTGTQKARIMCTRGEIMLLKKDYNASADFFLNAYSIPEIREREKGKIYAMVNAIEGFYRTKRSIESQNYLRRLQMLAYQSVGKNEDIQIGYEYLEAFRLYSEGNERSSEKRFTAILENYKALPEIHALKFKTRVLLSELYEKTGNVTKLLENETALVAIREQYYGSNSVVYHRSKLSLALFEIKYGKRFEMAAEIMRNSYDKVVSKEIDASSPENINYLYAYANLYRKTDQLDSAAIRLAQVMEISKKNFGDQSGSYFLAKANYTDILIAKGQYKEGLEFLQSLSSSIENIKIRETEIQQKIYLILGKLNKLIGEYDKSKSMFDKALAMDYSSSYNDFLLQAETSEQFASLYFQTNNFYRAERSLNKAFTLKKKNLPEGNPLFFDPINSYALLKLNIGDLESVEQYLKQASDIAEEVYGKKSLIGVENKILYGDFNYSIGDYKKAEAIYLESDQLVVGKLGNKHLKHAEILLKLISVRLKITTYKKTDIEKLYAEATGVVKNALGVNSPLYTEIIQNQARYFISIGKTTEATALLTEAEKYWKAKLGSDNKYIANIYELRGDIAYLLGKYSDADGQYTKAKDIYKSVFSENHHDYNNVYAKMARVHFMNKNADKAIAIMDDIIPKYLDFTVKYFPSMSFRQKQEYWKSIKDEFEFYNTLAFNSPKVNKDMWAKAYNNTLSTKALLLSSGVKLLNQVMSSSDTILIALYNDWISKKEYLLTILSMSKQQMTEQGIDRTQIEDDIVRIEKDMSFRSSLFTGEEKKKKLTSWEDVKASLYEGEYAVEIVRYRKFNKVFTDSVYYASFVINKGSSMPYVVLNNNGINLEKRNLKYYRNATITNVTDEVSYDAYWKDIKAVIPDGSVVYVSGDGVYNQINLEMLRHTEGVFAIDENKFVFVSNTKDLIPAQTVSVNKKQKEVKKENVIEYLLCGSPEFYTKDSKISNKKIPDLPGTEKEIRLIRELLTANGKAPLAYFKEDLTEDTLKAAKNPKVIHVATHGYFKESLPNEEDELASSPLLNSGILLHGSGDILDNPDNKYINQKDGVLTAYEAMNLTLDNTELVILSACETGRGEVQVGEGVAGLQRSFLLAGSKAIIVSLFKVNDDVTQKLMLSFYDKWLKTGDKRKAFAEAKKEIKQQYPEPVFWGAFMMIEGKPEKAVGLKTN